MKVFPKWIGFITVLFVVCSFSSSDAADRFTDNGDGTVTDHKLGLMWAKNDNNGDITWHQANKWIRYTFPESISKRYSNWRLPTLKELESLAIKDKQIKGYETECGQWVKIVEIIRLSCGWVWTAERDKLAPTARVFNYNNVYHYSVRMTHKRAYRALAVRNIE